jgi:CheY-like chemotaxis protein
MATILVVDDHPTNREFLVTLLGYRGHHLPQAADGAEALQVARAAHPDLIISDILMPTMDAYELVRQLRADPDLGHLQVILSTAHYLDHEASALAHQCGVPFILPKPSEPKTVFDVVDAALGLTSSRAPSRGSPSIETLPRSWWIVPSPIFLGIHPRKSWRWRPLPGYSPPRSMIGCVAITTPVYGGRRPHSSTSVKGPEKTAPRSGWRPWPA